ncbi:hypothetical protein TNCV_871531 [Trichonephila clavipes]|nr:hypothetical protein TNCV_871531 [Trichonephila clavipes]
MAYGKLTCTPMRKDWSKFQFKTNMGTGILSKKIFGPFELAKVLNGAKCLNFLRNNLPDLLEYVPFNIYRDMRFPQDG